MRWKGERVMGALNDLEGPAWSEWHGGVGEPMSGAVDGYEHMRVCNINVQ